MANLIRWDPMQDMTSLRDAMNELFAESFVRPGRLAGTYQPAMDLYETEDEYVVKVAAPGLKPDNFEITLEQNVLTIRGHTEAEEEKEDARYHIREQRYGEFMRTIQFPAPVDADRVQANLSNGILTIQVPKSESAKPKRITVQATEQ